MRKILIIISFCLLLIYPQTITTGAANGLTLWFYNVIPALFPAMLLTRLAISLWGDNIKRPLPFIIFTGLLCGYPIGAMSLSLMGQKNSPFMAYINITSPAFLLNYVLMMGLSGAHKTALLISIYVPVILCLTVSLAKEHRNFATSHSLNMSRHKNTGIEIIEDAINGTLENMLKLGAYIIISSVICQFIFNLSLGINIKCIICGFIEITTGIFYLSMTTLSAGLRLVLVCVFCAFGGLSCLFQTYTVAGSGFSAKKYICHKIILAIITAVISLSVAYVLKIL